MLERLQYIGKIKENFNIHPITALLGPRQCGKTTLAKEYGKMYKKFPKHTSPAIHHFDLEDPIHLAQLENPRLTLSPLKGLIIIDEIQLRPDLFPVLRVLVDERNYQSFLILGSASRDLIHQSSETLAGRIGYIELTPFQLQECGVEHMTSLWQRGGFPHAYLATTESASTKWRKDYISTFLERDLSQLGFNISPQDMRRFWTMLAHTHGNTLNYSELGRSLGVSDMTIRRYTHILEGAFMVRALKPWFANINKRQTKSPKVYIRDSGLLHTLLGVSETELNMHPKVGASFEGFAIEEIIRTLEVDLEDCYFWGIHSEAELDLLIVKNGKKLGFEVKYTDHPKLTKSMQTAQDSLELNSLFVIVPNNVCYPLTEKIQVLGLKNFVDGYTP